MILFLIGCNVESDNIRVIENTSRQVLIDDGPPLSQIYHIESIGSDSLITIDDFAQIQLFISNIFRKSIGVKGRGPCEYNSIRHISLNEDTLFILDPSTSKIVYYSIDTGNCLGEIILPELSDFSSFIRLEGAFYLLHANYSIATNLNKQLLYRLDDNSTLTPLGLRFVDIDANALLPPIQKNVTMRVKDNTIFMEFPLSDKLWFYNIDSGKVSNYELSLDGYERDYKTITDGDELLRLFNNELELISGFYLLEDFIAIITGKGQHPNRVTKIKFYNYDGISIGEIITTLYAFRVTEHFFSRLTEELDNPNADHPYVILNQDYHINIDTN